MPKKIRQLLRDPVQSSVAAQIIGISKVELFRRTVDGVYHHVKDHRGWAWYDGAELEAAHGKSRDSQPLDGQLPPGALNGKSRNVDRGGNVSKAAKQEKDPHEGLIDPETNTLLNIPRERRYTGEVAKVIFAELEKETPLTTIVIRHGVHPEVVASIVAAYHRLRGGLIITKDTLAAIEKLPLRGLDVPIESELKFYESLKKTLELPQPCAQCAQHRARFCAGCASHLTMESVAAASISNGG